MIFDFGGTLDTGGDHWSHVMRDAWRDAGADVDDATFRAAYIHGERCIAPLVSPSDTMLTLLRRKIPLQLAHAGLSTALAGPIAERCYLRARAHVGSVTPLLRELAGRMPLAVVSNFYGNLRTVLRDYGILQLFKAVVDSAEAGVRKPDPAIFALGLNLLATRPEETLVTGDSIDNDILPATSLHCPTALLTGRPWNPAATPPSLPPTCTPVSSLNRLPEIYFRDTI